MEKITVAVENHFGNTGCESFLSDSLAYLGCDFTLGALFDAFG